MKTARMSKLNVIAAIMLMAFLIEVSGCGGAFDYKGSYIPEAPKLQAAMKKGAADNNIPGMVVIADIPEEGRWVGTTGVMEMNSSAGRAAESTQTNPPISPNTRFRVGSITKTFVAMTTLQLAQEGKISLDSPVETYIPGVLPTYTQANAAQGINAGDKIGSKITIRQCLNHTNGLANYMGSDNLLGQFYTDPVHSQFTPQQLINASIQLDPNPISGGHWHYTNTGYILLAMVIEKVTGNTWEQEVTNRFIVPLGMSDTLVPADDETDIAGIHAHGYLDLFSVTDGFLGVQNGPLTDFTQQNTSLSWSAGKMISSPFDLMIWIKAISEGRLLNAQYQSDLMNGVEAVNGMYYGLGIIWEPNTNIMGHKGQIQGYDCTMLYQVVTKVAITACGNKGYLPPFKDVDAIVHTMFPLIGNGTSRVSSRPMELQVMAQ